MTYIIESTVEFISKKTGQPVSMVSYFKSHNTTVFAFNSMTGDKSEARQYSSKSLAQVAINKYFNNRKGVKAIRYEPVTAPLS